MVAYEILRVWQFLPNLFFSYYKYAYSSVVGLAFRVQAVGSAVNTSSALFKHNSMQTLWIYKFWNEWMNEY